MTDKRSLVAQPVDVEVLREAICEEYKEVARHPDKGFHSHAGRPLARIVGYEDA